jgi:hypothetical protein
VPRNGCLRADASRKKASRLMKIGSDDHIGGGRLREMIGSG